jgi:hypothetical protein
LGRPTVLRVLLRYTQGTFACSLREGTSRLRAKARPDIMNVAIRRLLLGALSGVACPRDGCGRGPGAYHVAHRRLLQFQEPPEEGGPAAGRASGGDWSRSPSDSDPTRRADLRHLADPPAGEALSAGHAHDLLEHPGLAGSQGVLVPPRYELRPVVASYRSKGRGFSCALHALF